MKRLGVILITAALIVGLVGCPAGPRYTLTIASTNGGSVATPGEGTFTYGQGTAASLVATPDVGFRFVGWTGDVGAIADARSGTTTIAMNGDYSITANFVAVRSLTVTSSGGGSVTAPGEGTFVYDLGAVVNLVAAADTGYRFVSWTGDVDGISDINMATTTISMSGDYSIVASFGEDEVVVFVDPNLEAAVRRAIAISERPIYARDMEQLASLEAEGQDISNLTGLEYASRLTCLKLSNNRISDISPLVDLTGLAHLGLGGNWISDISPLANLTGLTDLHIWANSISDISPLGNLTALTEIRLENNGISDITPLANLTSLKALYLSNNQIDDISSLANLTSLTDLRVESNQIIDISPLVNLTKLSQLRLGSNQIRDISPLENLTGLTSLDVGSNPITDLSPLVNLTNLTWLSLGDHQTDSLWPLANLTELTRLSIDGGQITDISALANLTNLTSLSIVENWITDVSPLAGLTNLRGLDLAYNKVSDISPLADLIGLVDLRLDHNLIGDISPVAKLTALTRLSLWSNQIGNLSPLANLTKLTELNLGCSRINDLSPLANLTGLRDLQLHDNQIRDISTLASLTSLSWLSLWGNQIGDLASLANLTNLAGLELGGNLISNISPLVENEGLSEGDYVDLRWNPLGQDSINIYMPELEERGVKFNPEFPLSGAEPCLLDTPWIKNPGTGNFYALTAPMSWMAAEACAQAWGAHLVTLNNWEEESWIKDTFGRDESFWIGFNVIGREHHEGSFAWSSGEPVIYTNWGPGEPNNIRGEDVAHMGFGDAWNDLSRHACLRGVVEIGEEPG